MYSERVKDHFQNPRNIGRLEEANGVGAMGSEGLGDYLVITIRVNPNQYIEDIMCQVKGCTAAVAASSITTEMAKGKHIYDALNISENDITDALGGLPDAEMHCPALGAGALRKAIYDYLGDPGL